MKQVTILSTWLCFCLLPARAENAQAPNLVNYQGHLTLASGDSLGTGSFSIEFNVYAVAAGGTPIWGPQRFSSVSVVNGHFNVIIGPTDETNRLLRSAWLQSESYLGLRVNGGAEIVPRQQTLSSPYALVSGMGVPIGSIVPWVPPRRVASLEEAQTFLPAGFLICDGSKPDDPGTIFDERNIPDLRDQVFLKGANPNTERIGSAGGTNSHTHGFLGRTRDEGGVFDRLSRPRQMYEEYAADRYHRHDIPGVTTSTSWIPKSIAVVYIIRVN